MATVSPATCCLLVSLLLLSFISHAFAQASSPFKGQGVDPVTAGTYTADDRVPVYVSIIFKKLVMVDEIQYRFETIFSTILTWQDPRAILENEALATSITADTDEMAAKLAECNQAADKHASQLASGDISVVGHLASPSCVQAVSKASSPSCNKPCSSGSTYCCDGVWLPALDISNSIFYSQDRYINDYIGSYNDTVFRAVRVHGVFTSPFDFRAFPFDHQELQVSIEATELPIQLFASLVARDTPTGKGGTGGPGFQSVEVTGWKTTNISLSCDGGDLDNSDYSYGAANSDYSGPVVWRNFSSDDPYFSGPDLLDKTYSSCVLKIRISRLSYYYSWTSLFPVLLIALVSFSIFFSSPANLSIRLSTSVTLFLSLVAAQFIVVNEIPRTTYITDYSQLVTATYFIFFFAVLESLLVHYITTLQVIQDKRGRSSTLAYPSKPARDSARGAAILPASYIPSSLPRKEDDPEAALLSASESATVGTKPGTQAAAAAAAASPAIGSFEEPRNSRPAVAGVSDRGGELFISLRSDDGVDGSSATAHASERRARESGEGGLQREEEMRGHSREELPAAAAEEGEEGGESVRAGCYSYDGGGASRTSLKNVHLGFFQFKMRLDRFATNQEVAFKFARVVDLVCGVALFVGYVVAVVIIFTSSGSK